MSVYKCLRKKVLQNTGKSDKPFFVKASEHIEVWVLGIKVRDSYIEGDYPDNVNG